MALATTQENKEYTRLNKIANEGFNLIEDVYGKTNHYKNNPSKLFNSSRNLQRICSYKHHQSQPLTFYHTAQVSTAIIMAAPQMDQFGRLVKIAEDGFKAIDEVYGRNYGKGADKYQLYQKDVDSVKERANSYSNVEAAKYYKMVAEPVTITSDHAAQYYGGLMINDYGNMN